MPRIVLLDTGSLGMVSHPRPNRDVVEWIKNLLQSGAEILVPEIADYEVRCELLRAKKTKGIKRLDDLTRTRWATCPSRRKQCSRPLSSGRLRGDEDDRRPRMKPSTETRSSPGRLSLWTSAQMSL